VRECARLGLATYAGETHTLLIEVGDGDAARLALLRDAQVHVRSARSFGLPRHIRVSARTPAENDVLLGALGRLVAARR
jgi:histidinol-phosphate/aromatic aminotransferase/cobyric acid decarboxylase-like protein